MAEGPFSVTPKTVCLHELNGPNIVTAGADETGSHPLLVRQGTPIYGQDGYGEAVHGDGVDEGVELYASSVQTSLQTVSASGDYQPQEFSVEVICNPHNFEIVTTAGVCGCYFYNNGNRRGWQLNLSEYTSTEHRIAFVLGAGAAYYPVRYAFNPVEEDWTDRHLYLFSRFDAAASSGLRSALRVARIEEDAGVKYHNVGSANEAMIADPAQKFQVGLGTIEEIYASRIFDGIISTVHILSEAKSDEWVAERYSSIQDWVVENIGICRRRHALGGNFGRRAA